MPIALAIVGTPDGFDFGATGDPLLSNHEVISHFDGLGFSAVDVPLGTSAWGIFKKSTSAGVVIGIGCLTRARELTAVRAGGYLGVGLLLKEELIPTAQVVNALGEFKAAVEEVAFGPNPYAFAVQKISDLPKIVTPQSCKELGKSQSPFRPTSRFARRTLTNCAVNGIDGIDAVADVIRIVLANHENLLECSVLIVDSAVGLAAAKKTWGSVSDYETLRDWLIAAKDEVKTAEENDQIRNETQERIARERREAEERHHREAQERQLRDKQAAMEASRPREAAIAREPAHWQTSYPQNAGHEAQAQLKPARISTKRDDSRDEERFGVAHHSSSSWWLAIVAATILGALISALLTYIVVDDAKLAAKYEQVNEELRDTRSENRELQESIRSLRQEVRNLSQRQIDGSVAQPEPEVDLKRTKRAGASAPGK